MKEKKRELRKLIRQRKTNYDVSTLKELSENILHQLEEHPLFRLGECVLLYHSLHDEVYTHSFIEKWSKTKTIILPVVEGGILQLRTYSTPENLDTGLYGIKEPSGEYFTNYHLIDLAIIPGMAFDSSGNRLGRGKGYYDKLLPNIAAPKIGICFPFQLVEYVPSEHLDVSMDYVIS